MRKFLCSITTLMLVIVIGCSVFEAAATTSNNPAPMSQNYCPDGYICVATNMVAKYYGTISREDISGIAVYKKGDNVIAYVPGHGHLQCYWRSTSVSGAWWFNANGGSYKIEGLKENI